MPTNTHVALATQTLTTAAAEVTFSSLGSYTDVILVSNFGTTAAGNSVGLRFNSDTGSNYSTTQVNGPMPFGSSWRGTNQTSITVFGSPVADGTPSTLKANGTIHIQNYGNSTTNKSVLSRYGHATGEVISAVGLWRNTNAVTSITLVAVGSTFLSGSTFSLYGIQAETANLPDTAKATGGTITYTNTDVIHTFTGSGTFTPNQSLTVDYLVVAGGGGGGFDNAAGGGAGGLRSTIYPTGGGGAPESRLSLSATGYTVTVGAGGSGATNDNRGSNGSNSVFGSITSTGGGGGGSGSSTGSHNSGNSGGSGGGARGNRTGAVGGAGTANQGFSAATPPSGFASTGGGGAGAASAASVGGSVGTAGGAGVAINISGSYVTYAGGGGASWNGNSASGGAGGGGAGATSSGGGANGSTNTGGGAGGGGDSGGGGGAGGSGIVVIRYAK